MSVSLFSIFDLLMGVLFGLVFFFIFYIHRLIGGRYYFGFGELIYGFKSSISLMAFLFRFAVILGFGVVVSLLFSNALITCFSAFLGALLIVWPAIVDPFSLGYDLRRKRWVVVLVYILFVIASVAVALLGFILFSYLKPAVWEYAKSFVGSNRLVVFIGDFFVILIILPILKRLFGNLNKKIKLSNARIEEDDIHNGEDEV